VPAPLAGFSLGVGGAFSKSILLDDESLLPWEWRNVTGRLNRRYRGIAGKITQSMIDLN
jgi:hypothetical protein